MTTIVDRSFTLADIVPGFVFALFAVPAAWIGPELWWLSLALVVLGAVGALITWGKLRKPAWPPDRVE